MRVILARDTSSNASVTKAGQLSSHRVGEERTRVAAVRDTRLQVRSRLSPMRAAGDRDNRELHLDRWDNGDDEMFVRRI
jgi:hypothetical protein